jgi:hypothetical protein
MIFAMMSVLVAPFSMLLQVNVEHVKMELISTKTPVSILVQIQLMRMMPQVNAKTAQILV